MPRKKDPIPPHNELDELLDHLPSGNGHDAEGLADAEESGELDEPIIDTRPSRQAKAKAKSATETAESAPESAPPAGKPRSARGSRKKAQGGDPDREVVKLPLLPLRDMVIFPHMVTSLFVGREKSLKAIEAA